MMGLVYNNTIKAWNTWYFDNSIIFLYDPQITCNRFYFKTRKSYTTVLYFFFILNTAV